MPYTATFRYIDKDFGFETLDYGKWTAEYATDEEFILAINRMAIASSQHALADFPEVEVLAKKARVTIRAINGQLFYTDLHSQSRKDMKVVPAEIIRLIDGKSLEAVFERDKTEAEEDIDYVEPKASYRRSRQWPLKVLAVVMMLVVFGFCSHLIWDDIVYEPRLRTAPEFNPSAGLETEVLRRYADVYVSEYREGAMLFELTLDGIFSRYEMWFSQKRNAFVLVPIDSYPLKVGEHHGATAMLAGEVYLLLPKGDDSIILHDIEFRRYHESLASIGEVLN